LPIYTYKHPKTGEIFETIRPVDKRDAPFVHIDGTICERLIIPSSIGYCGLSLKEVEVWDAEKSYVKAVRPKYVMTRKGKKIRYNESSMGY